MAQTKALDLINPEVMADAIAAKLPKAIRFAPYAKVDDTLVGRSGDTITRPKYGYIGPAIDLTEGVPMDPAKLSMTTTQVTVKEAGKAVEVTETAILTNVSGTLSEAENQLMLAMKDKIEIDYLATLGTSLLSFDGAPTTVANILGAVDVFDDEDEENYILFINNKDYTALISELINMGNGDVQNRALTKAEVVELVGVADIVKSKRLPVGTAYLQKQGAVEIVYKKQPEVKKDEDILTRSIILAGNGFYTTNLFDDSGVVKIQDVV